MRVATGMTNEQQTKEWMDRIYEVGEELEGFIDTSWKPGKEFKKRGYYRALASHTNVILCGHGSSLITVSTHACAHVFVILLDA